MIPGFRLQPGQPLEHVVDETGEALVSIAALRPGIDGKDRGDRDRLYARAVRDEAWVVGASSCAGR